MRVLRISVCVYTFAFGGWISKDNKCENKLLSSLRSDEMQAKEERNIEMLCMFIHVADVLVAKRHNTNCIGRYTKHALYKWYAKKRMCDNLGNCVWNAEDEKKRSNWVFFPSKFMLLSLFLAFDFQIQFQCFRKKQRRKRSGENANDFFLVFLNVYFFHWVWLFRWKWLTQIIANIHNRMEDNWKTIHSV